MAWHPLEGGWIKQLNKAWAVDVTGHDSLREQKTAAWLVVFFSRGDGCELCTE